MDEEEEEEDRTVTARSRRAALSRLSAPPPVPPLPIPFRLPSGPSQHQPFPRSPTTSVFSIPSTIATQGPSSLSSTTYLGLRSTSRLAGLPPSPPIHERKTRRLRKKSRPVPAGTGNQVYEMGEIGGRRADSTSEEYATGLEEMEMDFEGEDEGHRPRTPVRVIPGLPGPSTYENQYQYIVPSPSSEQIPPSSPPSTPLRSKRASYASPGSSQSGILGGLGRMGSVKRWIGRGGGEGGGRGKKGSTTSMGGGSAEGSSESGGVSGEFFFFLYLSLDVFVLLRGIMQCRMCFAPDCEACFCGCPFSHYPSHSLS